MKYIVTCKHCDSSDLESEGRGVYRCEACNVAGELGVVVYLKAED